MINPDMKTISMYAPFCSALLLLFVYANTRYLPPADKLPRIKLATFNVLGDLTPAQAVLLQEDVATIGGVTACTVNAWSCCFRGFQKRFHIRKVIKSTLSGKNSLIPLLLKSFPLASDRCPVHGISASVNTFISTLDLRI
jgi:hypothetical protein